MSSRDCESPTHPRGLFWPVVVAVALVLALFLAPFPAAAAWSDGGHRTRAALVHSLSTEFVDFWAAGQSGVRAELASSVDFWWRFHVVKAVLAAVLVVALVRLGSHAWNAYTSAATAAHRTVAGLLAAVTGLVAVVAIVILVANIQGVIAPLSSVLGLLPLGAPDPALARTLAEVRHDLAAGPGSPALEVLVHDFAAYHVAMAALGAVTTAVLVVTAVFFWQRRRRMTSRSQRGRRLLAAAAIVAVVVSGFFVVITAANLSTSARPAPALLGFFEGGR